MRVRTMALRASILSLSLSVAAAHAVRGQVPIPAPPQQGPIALRGATIHTVTNGVIENGTIVFANGVILAVGTDVALPQGTRTVDVTGKHIYPGLIDAFSTVGIEEIGAVDVTNDIRELGRFNANARPDIAVNPKSRSRTG